MNLNTVGKRISFGYVIVAVIIAACLIAMHFITRDLVAISRRASDIRAPTSEAATQALIGLADEQFALRLWLTSRDEPSRRQLDENWNENVKPALAKLADLEANWGREENKKSYREFTDRLDEFRSAVEHLSSAKDQAAALKEFGQTIPALTDYLRDRLQILIRNQSADLKSDLDLQEDHLLEVEWLRMALIAMVLAVSALAGWLSARAISRPLSKAVELADLVAKGNFSTKIAISGMEELNRLGSALERMRASLERQNWIQQSQIRLHEALSSATNPGELADAVAATVATSAKASVGAFYAAENQVLKVLGGYSLPPEFIVGKEVSFGEGIAGQAAADKTLNSIVAKDQATGLEFSTMLGNIKPREILAAPLVFRNETLGVLELASTANFSEREREFITVAAQATAIALNSSQKAEQVRNLLAETQTQSEELQAQQEELRNANEELQTRQEELESSNEELEEQKSLLESQKQSLDHKNEELDRVSRYKSEFLANMSHELRTPLNSQLILSSLLTENKGGNLTPKQLEYARTINASGQNLLQLINDILDLSKVEAGKLVIETQDVTVEEIVEGLRRDFSGAIEQKGLKLATEIDPGAPRSIQTDPLRLGQVLKNLVSNAVKFTNQGEIRIRVAPASRPNKEMLSFQVTDSGIGIPEEKLQAVFEAFEQVDSSTSRKYGGTGLGLAISRELAEILGGDIQLASKLGEGSTFTLTVPYSVQAGAGAKPATHRNTASQNQERRSTRALENSILIIEDDAHFANVLADLAKERGLQPIFAQDAGQGLELARSLMPACILLDHRLPGQNGLEILGALKKDPRTRQIPVHMISIDDHSREAAQLGAVGYLVKPASPQKLKQVIEKLQGMTHKKIHRVLVVDDEAVHREQIMQLVSSEQVEPVGVATAEGALEALTGGEPFDCMILDLKLPGQSGLELLKKIKAEKEIALPPVVIHTAKDLSRDEEEALRRYSDSIIIKGAKSDERLLDEVRLFIHGVARDLPKPPSQPAPEASLPDPSLSGRRVLLVDDDIRNVFALSSILEDKGVEVIVARNGQEALDALDANPGIQMVLMDIMMPVMDGHEAMRRIRKNPRHAKLPIIALTAKAMKGDKEACLQAGANDYLSKPIDNKQFFSLLRVWLGK